MGLQARLACSELERPFLYPLLKMLIDLMQRLLRVPAFVDFFRLCPDYSDYAQTIEYAPIRTADRTSIEPYPNSITGFAYETSLQLKVRDLSRCGGPDLALAFSPIIFMHDVEIAKPREFLRGVSEHPGERRICLTQASIKISSHHSERALLEDPPEVLLAATERRFRAFSIRNVAPVDTRQ